MRGAIRQILVVMLGISIAVPGWAASPVIGTVQGSRSAMVRGTSLVVGTTVYSDDNIETQTGGNALISLQGGGQLQLLSDSAAQVVRAADGNGMQVVVHRGIARFRATGQVPVAAVLEDATIRSAGGAGGAGYVAVSSPTTAVIGAEKGDLVVTTEHDGKSVTVTEGTAVSVKMVADEASPDDKDFKYPKKTHAKAVIIVGALLIAGALVAAVAMALSEPPHANPPAVSPFRP